MPRRPFAALASRSRLHVADRARVRDLRTPDPDQAAAVDAVRTVVVIRSRLDRAVLLAAVRHELRLPLGAAAVPPGALHLEKATDSSVVVASRLRAGCFRGVLTVQDDDDGSRAEYAVTSWHRRDGSVCGLRQLRMVNAAIRHAVETVDPEARVDLRPRA